jgi:uncharacterized membrane protein
MHDPWSLDQNRDRWVNATVPDTIGGIPIHPLVVHAVVVLIPLAALGVGALSLVPKWRNRYGVLVMSAAVAAALLVPVATDSGENLQEVVGESDLLDRHAALGRTMLWGAIPLAIVAVVLWWLGRRTERGQQVPRWASLLVGAVGVVAAVAVVVQIVLIGHSGAKAVWG